MIIKENRTNSYIGTVDLSSDQDMLHVKLARNMVKEANAFLREKGERQLYVKLQGRGHRMGKRRYNQSLPLKFSKTADVYVYQR